MRDSEAKKRWDRENTKQVMMKLNRNTDADIIELLESIKDTFGIQGYIKSLIRLDKAQHPKEYPPTRYSATTYGCGICGHELEKGHPHFCSNCGQAIDWRATKKAGK